MNKIKIRGKFLAVCPCCFYCKITLDRHTATLDHILPRSKGGSNANTNLVLACFECNQKKADKI